MLRNDPNYLKIVILGHKTLDRHFDALIKSTTRVLKHTDSPPPKGIRQTKSAEKSMMIIFVDRKSPISQCVVPLKTTMNGEYYITVLKFWRQHA